ncbi:MAG TPA: hypothetical protein VFN10_13260 [Thermoanaerobaculia bacterium]|nr:hypothetical protein [Thermoanaerobaculia bacterium]
MRLTSLVLSAFLCAAVAVAQPQQHSNSLVTLETSASEILIPVAGSAAGQNGTFFRSDINIVNFSDTDQIVRLYWLPQGASGATVAPRDLPIAARSGYSSEDFVTNIMQQSGIGAILIRAITPTGAFDPNGKLYATARIWTPQPGTTGNVSQSFFTIDTLSQAASSRRWIFGVRRDARYRMNAGVANASDLTQRYRVSVIAGGQIVESTEIELLPMSMQQVAMPGTTGGALQLVVENITNGTRSLAWQSWASSIDNVTGDAWSMMAFPAPVDPVP